MSSHIQNREAHILTLPISQAYFQIAKVKQSHELSQHKSKQVYVLHKNLHIEPQNLTSRFMVIGQEHPVLTIEMINEGTFFTECQTLPF